MTTTLEQPADTGGDLLADLNDALRDAMEGHDAGFAAARAAWAEVLGAKMEGAALGKRLAELVAELDAVRERITRQTDEILEKKRAAEQRVISGTHAERALMRSLPAALTAAMDAASRRRGKLLDSLGELKAATENARRRESSYRSEAQRWRHPGEEAHRDKCLRIADASAARAAEYDEQFRSAEIEIRELAEAIENANRAILS